MKSLHLTAMAALCFLSGSGWLLTEYYPTRVAPSIAGCLHFALIGCTGLAFSLWGTQPHFARLALPRTSVWTLAIGGIGIFALPIVTLDVSARSISQATSLTLFCAVPLFTVVAELHLGTERQGSTPRHLLLPSLIGLAGALLLFPVEVSPSARAAVAILLLVGCVSALALATVRMNQVVQGIPIAPAVAIACFASAFLLALYTATNGVWLEIDPSAIGRELFRSLLIDLPVVWITLWLVREVSPARLSARFLLAPLVTMLEGYASLHLVPPLRSLVALGLLAAGGLLLIFKDQPAELPGLRLP